MGHALLKTLTVASGLALSTLLMSGTGALASAASLGPEVALSTIPHSGFVGRVSVSPSHGAVGTPVTVKAEGLPPNAEVDFVWRTVRGKWLVSDGEYHGRDFQPVAYRIAHVTTDGQGAAQADFVAPEDFGFSHDIVVQQGGVELSQSAFFVDMSVDVSPKSAPEGTPINVSVRGIGWRALHNSWLLLYDNRFTGWMSSVTTDGSADFQVPATGGPGQHVFEVVHGGFTFAYRNMQQSPEPDRPQFAIPITVTGGTAVLPPAAGSQVQTAIERLPAPGDLSVQPAFSPVGGPVTISGSGFTPDKTYDLSWSTVTGNRVSGGGWETSRRVIARARADGDGNLTYAIRTPDDLGGSHELSITDGDRTVTGTLWIQPTALPMTVTEGPVGTPFTIHLKGVGWTETANIFTIDYDNAYVGYACGFNSQGDVEIHLTATGQPGWHFIDLYPAIYKGKERAPNNFRLPQLTWAADHPGEDLPHFRFAFKVTELVR